MTPLQQAAMNIILRWDSPEWKDQAHTSDYINDLRAALVDRVPLSESLIGEFYMGVAGAQPTLLTRQLFTGIVKAVEQAHNIKES